MSEKSSDKIEEFARDFMAEEGLKGKARRMKIMRIIENVGFDKKKVRTALMRSTINERIEHK
ncbi:MAG: hypothetical protein ACQERB_09725 [Promethearchaeati archaeon]|nr:MAG: hypothetical protein EU543_02535 [Candidatus Lokiarchaeota archaeon]